MPFEIDQIVNRFRRIYACTLLPLGSKLCHPGFLLSIDQNRDCFLCTRIIENIIPEIDMH